MPVLGALILAIAIPLLTLLVWTGRPIRRIPLLRLTPPGCRSQGSRPHARALKASSDAGDAGDAGETGETGGGGAARRAGAGPARRRLPAQGRAAPMLWKAGRRAAMRAVLGEAARAVGGRCRPICREDRPWLDVARRHPA